MHNTDPWQDLALALEPLLGARWTSVSAARELAGSLPQLAGSDRRRARELAGELFDHWHTDGRVLVGLGNAATQLREPAAADAPPERWPLWHKLATALATSLEDAEGDDATLARLQALAGAALALGRRGDHIRQQALQTLV